MTAEDDPLGLHTEEIKFGEPFVEHRLNNKISACESQLKQIAIEIVEEGDSEEKSEFEEILGAEYKGFRKATVRVFDESRQIRDIVLGFKNLLKTIGNDLGYYDKLGEVSQGPTDGPRDNLATWFYWFRLHAKAVGEWEDGVQYSKTVFESRPFRNIEEHDITGEYTRPDYAALTILIWFALEDVLKIWSRSRDETPPDSDYTFGFISNINHSNNSGMITAYNRDPDPGSYFERLDANFFPEYGQPVQFKDNWNDEHDNYKAWKVRPL
jgi:hypothetical protein